MSTKRVHPDMSIAVSPLEYESESGTTVDETTANYDWNQNREFVQFVRQEEIKKRVCNTFIAKAPRSTAVTQSDATCFCGLKQSLHGVNNGITNSQSGQLIAWKPSKHTSTEPTDAFGEIEFTNQRVSKFIRLDYKTEAHVVADMMLKFWNVGKPNLLISVTGGAKNFPMTPRLTEVFRNGFIKAATTTGAWIITGGTNTGVMQHVGEAVRDYTIKHGTKNPVVALGIASWGCINNRQTLVDKSDSATGCWPAKYQTAEFNETNGFASIDPNHTHFLLVDNGTQNKFGVEINFRSNLESYLSNRGMDLGGTSTVKIPIVCVVLEGGPNTLETVKKAVENGTPAIVVAGTGRAADILAYAYANTTEELVEVEDKNGKKHKRIVPIYTDDLWSNLRSMIEEQFGAECVADSIAYLKTCIKHRDHLTVFQVDNELAADDVDVTILRSLLKVSGDKGVDQLKLALAWNRVDIARNEIFAAGQEYEISELNELMYLAIVNDRVDFVKLLLEKGVTLRQFLTATNLLRLYNDRVTIDGCNHLANVLDSIDKDDEQLLSFKHIGSLLKDVIGEFFDSAYSHEPYASVKAGHFLNKPSTETTGKQPGNQAAGAGRRPVMNNHHTSSIVQEKVAEWIINHDFSKKRKKATVQAIEFDVPAIELFIWSVLMRRQDLAVCFLEEGKSGIAAALTAELILQGFVRKEHDPEAINLLQDQISFFEDLAIGMLSECYSSDLKKAQKMVVRELPEFGSTTVLRLAVEANNMKFVAHPVCQSVLSEIWSGELRDDNSNFKMMTSVLFPLVAPLMLHYDHDKTMSSSESSSSIQRQPRSARNYTEMSVSPSSKESVRRSKNPCTRYFRRLYQFFSAPVVVFAYNSMSYLGFLLLYGIILLTDFRPQVHVKEMVLIAYIGTLLLEEIRQMFLNSSGTNLRLQLYNYVSEPMNILDLASFTTYLAGLILRFIPLSICLNCFYASRIILAINYMLFFSHIFNVFSAHPTFGPKLVIIGRMIIDLVYFVLILLVFIAAYGVASQVILYPNSPLEIRLARDVLSQAWWNVFGQLNIDEVSGHLCSNQSATASEKIYDAATCAANGYDTSMCLNKDDQCPAIDWFVPIVLAVYALITNVLMINLLIAMFNDTFVKVEENTFLVWKMQRYHLVNEFFTKPILVPPLVIFSHIYLVFRLSLRQCGRCASDSDAIGFRMKFSPKLTRELVDWENINAVEYLRKTAAQKSESVETLVKLTTERVEHIAAKVDKILESSLLMQSSESNAREYNKLPTQLDERISYLEDQMRRTSKALDWLVETIGRKTSKPTPTFPDVDDEREKARKEREEIAKRKKEEVARKLKLLLETHSLCRNEQYPSDVGQDITRFPVPDEFVPFDVEYREYEPEEYTANQGSSDATDGDLLSAYHRPLLAFNEIDAKFDVNRQSFIGLYKIADGLPQNPQGRTGLRGRGVLPRWGPNHVALPIITRFKVSGTELKASAKKPTVEYLSVLRTDCREWAFPEIFFRSKDCSEIEVNKEVRKFFLNEAVYNSESEISGLIDQLCSKNTRILKCYLDDPRNTDNAWIEVVVYSYHVADHRLLKGLAFKSPEKVQWRKLAPASNQIYKAHSVIASDAVEFIQSSYMPQSSL